MTNRYANSRRQARRATAGRVAKANGRPDKCRYCGEQVPAGAGQLYREESGAWSVVHIERTWAGSPVSGQYTGGCPAETDRMNTAGKFGRDGQFLSEYDRIASAAAMHGSPPPVQAPPGTDLRALSAAAGPKYAYTQDGARMTVSSQRCEDAPCCGCCD